MSKEEKPKVFIERAAPLTVEGIRAICGTNKEYEIYVKRLMTDVAEGKVSKKDAELLIKSLKTPQNKPVKGFKGKHTLTRKKVSFKKERGVKIE